MGTKPLHESAHIITHKHPITQANFLEFPKEIEIGADSNKQKHQNISEIQSIAFELYDLGLNVFPLPIGAKGGYPWKSLQYTRLNRNHRQYGLRMLFAGECNLAIMCGRTSRNLFVIDCESQDSLHYHTQQLRQRQIPLWIAETRRGGHIYLLAEEGEVSSIPTGTLQDAEIKGGRGYVLAPPSLHPGGTKYRWLYQEGNEPPTVSIHQIDWLRDKQNKPVVLDAYRSKPISSIKQNNRAYSPLSRRTRNYIHHGDTTPEGSRNNELFNACCDMAGNGFTENETRNTVFAVAQSSGLEPREIETTIRSAYSQKRTPSRPATQNYLTTPDWKWAIIFADQHRWTGRTANSQRAIFTALIHRAKVSSNEDNLFRASIRELATLSRTGTATVQKILNTFCDGHFPLLKKCGHDKISKASLWKFGEYVIQVAKQVNPDTLKESPQWLSSSVSDLSLPDAIERNALGYNGYLVYRTMTTCNKPLYLKELVELTGLSNHQVKYALKKLRKFGLICLKTVSKIGYFAYNLSDEELDQKISEITDVIGKGEKRAQRFRNEREIYSGKKLFFARLRYERSRFKQQVYEILAQTNFSDMVQTVPLYREVINIKDKYHTVKRRRIALYDLDDEYDRSIAEFGLSLGAEITLTITE